MRNTFFLVLSTLVLMSCQQELDGQKNKKPQKEEIAFAESRIAGASLEMPAQEVDSTRIIEVKTSGASWVSMIPYAVTKSGDVEVIYHHDGHWWGESVEGTKKCIQMAKLAGLKVMLKPHVWVVDEGWPGKFDAGTEERWKVWEKSYRAYILEFAEVAESEHVELFCIGTEYRISVVKRPDFWRKLIKEVRAIYSGKLTYAANWDNYEKVRFWSELDLVGVDAYFPLSKAKEPTLEELKGRWRKLGKQLGKFSKRVNKPILFTEYGARSIDHANSGKWGDYEQVKPNMRNQKVYYQAFFESIWQEKWMAGGFFWKWHLQKWDSNEIGGQNNDDYTPQGKPALETIREWYKRSSDK